MCFHVNTGSTCAFKDVQKQEKYSSFFHLTPTMHKKNQNVVRYLYEKQAETLLPFLFFYFFLQNDTISQSPFVGLNKSGSEIKAFIFTLS